MSTKPLDNQTADLGQLDRVETRQLRLSISIPALMLLYTLLVSVVLHLNLKEISTTLPSVPAREEAESASYFVLLLGTIGSLAAGGVGLILAWQIIRPLRVLMSSMRRVGEGDLSRTNIERLGELGDLGSAFNRMVDQLNGIFEQRDRQIRESALGSLITLDSASRVLGTDPSLKRILGISGESLQGRGLTEGIIKYVDVKQNREFFDMLGRLLRESGLGRAAEGTAHLRLPDREGALLVSAKATPLHSHNEDGPACILDLRDLSSMESFLQSMQRADRMAAVGTLATGIAHEIRNPLASIRGMVQLLGEDLSRLSERPSDEYLTRVLREVDRLDRLVGGIMDFANTESGPASSVDVNLFLREAWETAYRRVDGSGDIRVEWALCDTLPACFLEEGRMMQVFNNLLVNALEEVTAKGGMIRIETAHRQQSRRRPIQITISNTGEPIPDMEREQLFEPFYTTKPQGTGLGLPIAYQIVTANGGTLELECDEGMIHFIVCLPLDRRILRSFSDSDDSSEAVSVSSVSITGN